MRYRRETESELKENKADIRGKEAMNVMENQRGGIRREGRGKSKGNKQ